MTFFVFVAKVCASGAFCGAGNARGVEVAHAMGPRHAAIVTSDDVDGALHFVRAHDASQTVVVHIKNIFDEFVRALPACAHVVDILDHKRQFSPAWLAGSFKPLVAQSCGWLVHSPSHAKVAQQLGAKGAWVVRHHTLPDCAPDAGVDAAVVFARSTLLIVGYSPAPELSAALHAWSANGTRYAVKFETDLLPNGDAAEPPTATTEEAGADITRRASSSPRCAMLRDVPSVALAWDQPTNKAIVDCVAAFPAQNAAALRGRCWLGKPAERLVNPMALGIPTLGFAGFNSFKDALGATRRCCLRTARAKAAKTALIPRDDACAPPRAMLARTLAELKGLLEGLVFDYETWLLARRYASRVGELHSIQDILQAYAATAGAALTLKAEHRC